MTKDEFNLFFETFKPNNSYFECRILNTGKGVLSGYFNDTEKLSRAINRYNGKYNIFFTLNELDENIVARSQNRLSVWSKHTTTDAEIIRRKWVLIDLDPVRPSGIASTSKELGKAEALADKIVDFLYKEGFPEAVRAMSGNGHHILLPVDLPNDPDITKLIKDFLLVLDSMFSTAEVNVDVSTYNPARITKLYGTIACKGDSTKDRPHRKSYIISMPNTSMRMDKLFVDPSAVDVKALPTSIVDTVTALSGEYMVGFDNIDGKISPELSNLWCVCCSTGYYSKRKLFSDNDSIDIKLNARLSFSGITTITDRADFIDRCICLSCERIAPTQRRTVEEILNEFKEDLPYLLYKGFCILLKAIKVHRTLELKELPRMADFATWGYAIAEVMKYGGERFLEAYQQNQRNLLEVMVEEDSLLTVLISFVEQRKHFVGSMAELYALLVKEAQAMEVNTVNSWCKNLNSLSRKLFQSQSVLGQFDIHLQRGKSNGKRYIEIWKGEERHE